MSKSDDAIEDDIKGKIEASLACLGHAKKALGGASDESLEDVSIWIEACTKRLADLPVDRCQRLQPLMFALVDELGQTIEAYQAEMKRLRTELTSARQSKVAGAAYRQVQRF